MLPSPPLVFFVCLAALSVPGCLGQSDVPSLQSRPYAVLLKQNLVLMGIVFSVLLMVIILMAVCIYKPIRRR